MQSLKFVVAGGMGVGKTRLLLRFVERDETAKTMPTIGADFRSRNVSVPPTRVGVWDTSGDTRYGALLDTYCLKCDGIVLVFVTH